MSWVPRILSHSRSEFKDSEVAIFLRISYSESLNGSLSLSYADGLARDLTSSASLLSTALTENARS